MPDVNTFASSFEDLNGSAVTSSPIVSHQRIPQIRDGSTVKLNVAQYYVWHHFFPSLPLALLKGTSESWVKEHRYYRKQKKQKK